MAENISAMRKLLYALSIFIFLPLLFGCKKCYDCKKQIIIEVNGKEVPTDSFYEENTCDKGRRKYLKDEGYTCIVRS